MVKFKKVISFRIVLLLVTMTFFLNSTGYGRTLPSKEFLRPPLCVGNINNRSDRLEFANRLEELKQILSSVDRQDLPEDEREFIITLVSNIDLPPNAKVLDIGCGDRSFYTMHSPFWVQV